MQEHIEDRCNIRQKENPKLLQNARAFLDCDDLNDLRLLLDDVKKSKAVVVMLTKKYFTRPWCLAELHAAIQSNIPIIPVKVVDGGYDFEEGKRFLSTLTPESLDTESKGASEVLKDIGIDVTELGKKLADVIPNIIALPFNPSGSKNVINAQIDDIIEKVLKF